MASSSDDVDVDVDVDVDFVTESNNRKKLVDDDIQKCMDAIEETSRKVDSALLPAIESHGGSAKFASSKYGLDFLDVKNSLLLSYLIDLTVHVRNTVNNSNNNNQKKNIDRIIEMKIIMDKVKGMDKKLRYQIDKLLNSSTPTATYASGASAAENKNGPEDPLQFRPDPTFDSDDDEEDSGGDGSNIDDEDDDLAAAKKTLSLSKEKHKKKERRGGKSKIKSDSDDDGDEEDDDGNNNIYRAPRLQAVPYGLEMKEKQKRERRRIRATELAHTLREQYGDQPDIEDMHGGSDMGKQRVAARRLAEREQEKKQFEEANFVRLTTSRKEKKEKKRIMQKEHSNLAAIADLGNLVRETQEFGRSDSRNDGDDNDDDEYEQRTTMRQQQMHRYDYGKRRREEEEFDTGSGHYRSNNGNRSKVGKAKNALQAALYNNMEGNRKKKKGKR